MEGFFDGVDTMVKAMASASAATAQGAPAETLVPQFELISAEKSTQVKRVVIGEFASIPVKIPTP